VFPASIQPPPIQPRWMLLPENAPISMSYDFSQARRQLLGARVLVRWMRGQWHWGDVPEKQDAVGETELHVRSVRVCA